MDIYKKMQLEIPGIVATIEDYSSDSSAAHIIPELKKAMESQDKDAILYCLDVIAKWYVANIQRIHENSFVFNPEEHDRNMHLISEFADGMKDYVFTTVSEDEPVISSSPVVFLSHRSSDKAYGDALEQFFVGLGLKNEQLIYTSHPLHKIPLDANIYDYLRQNINRNVYMIILWSNEYLQSPACLNEMGAAWVARCDYTNVYTPSFVFGNPKYHECAVDTRKMGAVLNGDSYCKQNMIELKNKIQELFGLENDESKTTYLLDNLMNELREAVANGQA